jgi:hypothetical protein
VHKQDGGYQWGQHGKIYRGKGAKKKAEKQAAAAYAHGYKGDSVGHGRAIRGLVQELKFSSMDSLEAADFGFQNEFRPASLDRDEVVKTFTEMCRQTMQERFNCPLNDIDLQKFERLIADWVGEINQPGVPGLAAELPGSHLPR